MYKFYPALGADTATASASASGSVSLRGEVDKYKNSQDQSTPGGIAAKGVVDLAEAGGDESKTDAVLEGIVTAACAAAGAAGCTATVVAAPIAPLCGIAGSLLGPTVFKGIKAFVGLFRSSSKKKAYLQRQREEAEKNQKLEDLSSHAGEFRELVDAMEAGVIYQHSQLFPDLPQLTINEVRDLYKTAGLALVWDVGHFQDGNADGKCVADSWQYPAIERPILLGDKSYETRVAHGCKYENLNVDYRKVAVDKYTEILASYESWIKSVEDTTKIVMAALVNAASNAETQQTVAQLADILRNNAALAADTESLKRELVRRAQYRDTYLRLKREAADKRLAAEKQKIDAFVNQATAVQRTERLLLWTAGGILVSSVVIALLRLRRSR
jgi:hypothetical protein